jgi:hypothetical protein
LGTGKGGGRPQARSATHVQGGRWTGLSAGVGFWLMGGVAPWEAGAY